MDAGARLQAVKRLTWLVGAIVLWGAAIFLKLISIQVIHHKKYLAMARQQQEMKVEIPAPRGTIFDRNGQPLAMSVPVDSVSVNPQRVPNLSVAAEVLSTVLNIDRAELDQRLRRAAQAKKGFLWVKRKIKAAESERLKSLHLDWIDYHPESIRVYPGGQVASHVIGMLYVEEKDEKGAAGIEKALDNELRGRAGTERLLTDVHRRGLDSEVSLAAQVGKSITLSLDQTIQYAAEIALQDAVERNHAKTGSIVVMNPNTGEVYALANYPTYDPNVAPSKNEPKGARLNLGASVPFEPGSVFKVVTLTAALETTNIRPSTIINCGSGAMNFFGRVVHEAKHGYGSISMADVLAHSSNIGAIQIGLKVGEQNLLDYVHRFGFGAKSGVLLPAEASGRVRKLERWTKTSIASVAMGQEISTTTLQLARACSVIANGGMLVKPRLVLKDGDVEQKVEAPVRVIRPGTAITMRQMMEGVVIKPFGTGFHLPRINGYSFAGKTGSAQIYDVESHHYTHLYNASFMGFAPVSNPSVVVVVSVNGSKGFGAPVAGPAFSSVMTVALRALDVPKDLPETVDPTSEDQKTLLARAATRGAEADNEADAVMADENSHEPNILEEEDMVPTLATAAAVTPPATIPVTSPIAQAIVPKKPEGPQVPNFRGKTMRAVMEEAAELGLRVMVAGSGVARQQVPPPGSVLQPGEPIRVQFAR